MKKKPIALILTDTHLSQDSIVENLDIFRQSIEVAKREGVQTVIHLGDIFHSRKSQPLNVLIAFLDILDRFQEANIQLIAIPGNHDKIDYEDTASYLDMYNHHKAIKVISEEEFVIQDGVLLAFMPFFHNDIYVQRIYNIIEQFENRSIFKILLTHIAVNGVRNNDGSLVEDGIEHSIFESFDKVLVGHYHNRSSFKNIHYIGAAYPMSYGEDNEKGFILLYDDVTLNYIKPKFREYHSVFFDLNKENVNIDKIIQKYQNDTNHIRFVFTGSNEKLAALDDNKIKRFGIDIKKKPNGLVEGIEIAEKNEYVSFDKKAIISEFEQFVDKLKMSKKKRNEGLKILKDALYGE